MKRIRVGDKFIGEKEPCFIIAEAGVNHNGDIKLAKKLVDAAIWAGADAVKFQTFKAEEVAAEGAQMAAYQEKNIGKRESQVAMLKKLELGYDEFSELKTYCDKKGVIFLSTPHDASAVEILDPLVPLFKVGSGDLTNFPLLKKLVGKGKPIILSTGMASMEEVEETVDFLKSLNLKDLILLHCTSVYPCPVEEVNLRTMETMQKKFDFLVGYSDHTLGIEVSVAAVVLEAPVLEKHFTLDKNMEGPDHKASLEPEELKELVRAVRNVEKAMGSAKKETTSSEREIKVVVRKSLVARVPISKGAVVEENMLTVKRPGSGIDPRRLVDVVGKKAKKDIKKDEVLTWSKV